MDARHLLGKQGEKLSRDFLKKKGFRILRTNFRNKHGEIDLVAEDGEILVFVEVKTQRKSMFGPPEWKVDWRKQLQLVKVAESFLQTNNLQEKPCRFDVIGITVESGSQHNITHLEDAFHL